jgi:hypothetical protein
MTSILGVVVIEDDERATVDAVHMALADVPGVRLEPVAGSVRFANLVDALSPTHVPGPGFVAQALRNARARVEFLAEWAPLTADQVAELAGSAAGNRRATAHRWRERGSIFAVEHQQRALYPSFQFDVDTGRPKPGIATVLAQLPRALVDGGWQLAFWFTTPNDLLGWRRPADVLDADPGAVIAAADAERREWRATAGKESIAVTTPSGRGRARNG